MTKKYILGICVCLFLFGITGCGNSKSKSLSLQDIVKLSASDISSIKTSEGGGKQTIIKSSKQKKDICSFLSKIDISQKYVEEKTNNDVTGGSGAYFLITYSNNASSQSHIQIFANDKKVKIMDVNKDGTFPNKWRVYTISDPSQITKLKEILSMKPVD